MAVAIAEKQTYEWVDGARKSLDAQMVGERVEEIRERQGGTFRADDLIDDARHGDSPLHDGFEWNNDAAATKYRLQQAFEIVCSLRVRVEMRGATEPQPIRAYVLVTEQTDSVQEHVYTAVRVAFANVDWRQEVLARAQRELDSWRKRYENFEEFASVVQAIRAVQIDR